MYFYLIGNDYKSAPINIREEFYRNRSKIEDFWRNQKNGRYVTLFTCNRIEVYAIAEDKGHAFESLDLFKEAFAEFFSYAYVKYGREEVFRHVLRLATGLESQLQGELQISAQLNNWLLKGRLPDSLKKFLEQAISLSETIRTNSGFDDHGHNIADVIYRDLKEKIDKDKNPKIIIVGTGNIAQLFARYRRPQTDLIFLAHKNYDKAHLMAQESGAKAFLLKDLSQVLPRADALISATASPHYVLGKEDFFGARDNPLYIYDLAIPRDIQPQAGHLDGVSLYNLDNLDDIFRRYNLKIKNNINLAQYLIEEALKDYEDDKSWHKAQSIGYKAG